MSAVVGCTFPTFDVSHIRYPSTLVEKDTWEMVVKCLVISIMMLVAIIGNVLIISIVILSKKMRTTTNFYIVNLAIADLLVACIPMWIYVTNDLTHGWILGAFLCKFNAFVQVCAMCTISFTMMAIAGDRFFAIVFPLKSRVTQRKVKIVLAIIWTCSISIGIPVLLYYQYIERKWSNYVETFCTDIWPMIVLSDGSCDGGTRAEQTYWTVVVAALNWIPMLMMTIIYTVIIQRLQCGRMTNNGSDAMSTVQRRSAKRVVIMLFVLLITFMVCTLPFQVSTIYEIFKPRTAKFPSWYQPVYFSAITLMYAHSTINPIVYGAMNQTFRNGFSYLIDRFIRSGRKPSWKSQNSVLESGRGNISTIQKTEQTTSMSTSVTELVRSSSELSLKVLDDADKKYAE